MQNLHHAVAVGGIELPGNLFLAPVAGYSDAAFRSVCIDEGADLCFTEMVSSEALTRGHSRTQELLVRADNEKAWAIQLFGSQPAVLARACEAIIPLEPLVVDLNCGCPVPKIVRNGAGSALMREPGKLADIVRAMSLALAPAGIPLTVKIRLGWDAQSINYHEVAGLAVEAGAAAVTLHARTRAQAYSGTADWTAISQLVRDLRVPVFGSGDISSAEAVLRFMVETGAAGVMIARGAMGNPGIFRETLKLLEGGTSPVMTTAQKAEIARRHLALSVVYLGERTACVEFRKQFCSYTKGSKAGAELRNEAVHASSAAQFEGLFQRWVEAAGI